MSEEKIKILERSLKRERKARKQAEAILEQKSMELFRLNEKLSSSNKMLEALLDDQSSQLNIIVDNSSIGIVLNQGKNFIKTNKAFQHLLGYTEDELLEMSTSDIVFKEDYPKTRDQLMAMSVGDIDQFSINHRYKRKDGSAILCKTSVSAVRNNEGDIKYRVALIEDITQVERQSRLLKGLNSLSVSILGKTDIFEIGWEIAKNTANQLGLEDCAVFRVDEEQGKAIQIASFDCKETEDFSNIEPFEIPITEGIVGHVVQTKSPILVKDTSEDPRYVVEKYSRSSELAVPIIVDQKVVGIIDSEHTSKNHFNEEHLETFVNIANLAAAQFNNAINVMKRNIVEQQKTKLLKNLEVINQELNDYAHIVSHDLKSPLHSMHSVISWIKEDNEGKLDEDTLEHLNILLRKVDKMNSLIDGILRYSSIDREHHPNQQVDINEVITDVVEILSVPNHIEVITTNELPIVYADKIRIQQLFQNIIGNSVKYIYKEKGIIKVSSEDLETHFKFAIEDNGKGIAERYFEKIFKVFQSLEKNNDLSTGIGLSIVKKIIEMYEGEIWLTSTEGVGTTFYFTLKK